MSLAQTVAPAPAADSAASVTPSPAPRLVPALIGRRNSQTQTVWIPCPAFCTDNHATDRQVAVEDICHGGDMAGVSIPTMADPDTDHYLMFVRVASDPAHEDPRMRAAHVLLGDCSAEDAFLTPGMADEVAADLVAFAAQIRAAARTARTANQLAA